MTIVVFKSTSPYCPNSDGLKEYLSLKDTFVIFPILLLSLFILSYKTLSDLSSLFLPSLIAVQSLFTTPLTVSSFNSVTFCLIGTGVVGSSVGFCNSVVGISAALVSGTIGVSIVTCSVVEASVVAFVTSGDVSLSDFFVVIGSDVLSTKELVLFST